MTAPTLSERELLVLRHVAAGRPLKAIARELGKTDSSIGMILYRLRERLGATGTPHLVAIAYRTGLLRVPGCACEASAS